MNSDPLFQDAVAVLSEATNLDRNGKPNDALLKYTTGVEKLVEYMRCWEPVKTVDENGYDSWRKLLGHADQQILEYTLSVKHTGTASRTLSVDDLQKKRIGDKVTEYLNRAEELKSQVRHEVEVLEQRRILADSTGHGYESVFSKCLNDKLTAVHVQDAYIVAHHQILNFIRFCEMLVRSAKNIRLITLKTGTDAQSNQSAFNELEKSLKTRDIRLTVKFEPNLHDREIKFNNGWVVKIGRGLDYFKNPGKYAIGACDMNLRKCHETTIDIFKIKM